MNYAVNDGPYNDNLSSNHYYCVYSDGIFTQKSYKPDLYNAQYIESNYTFTELYGGDITEKWPRDTNGNSIVYRYFEKMSTVNIIHSVIYTPVSKF